MSPRPTVVKDEEPTSEFVTKDLEIRGKTFRIRELTSSEYDKCVSLATDDSGLDTVKLLRWMLIKSVIEPADFNADELGKLSFTTVRELSKAVNDVHFPVSPEDSLGNP